MSTMVVEVYDALRSIGIAEDKATKAAEAMATLEPQFATIRSDIEKLRHETKSDIRVLNLKVNLIIAALAVLGSPALWLLVRIALKTGALPV